MRCTLLLAAIHNSCLLISTLAEEIDLLYWMTLLAYRFFVAMCWIKLLLNVCNVEIRLSLVALPAFLLRLKITCKKINLSRKNVIALFKPCYLIAYEQLIWIVRLIQFEIELSAKIKQLNHWKITLVAGNSIQLPYWFLLRCAGLSYY